MESVSVPIGTVPIYEAGVTTQKIKPPIADMTEEDMFKVI